MFAGAPILRACLPQRRDPPRIVRHRRRDREIIASSATTAGISGETAPDLMVACVERRFGISKAPQAVEWLSDNGSAYIAKNTLDTASALALNLGFTPVRSTELNGIAEAFVSGSGTLGGQLRITLLRALCTCA